MTIAEVGIKTGDILVARRLFLKDDSEYEQIIDFENQCLTPKAIAIFEEWYNLYKNQETGLMDAESVAKFISRATNMLINKSNERVASMIKEYD